MLLKLTTSVNFSNILRTTFALISLDQKTTKPNCNKRKASQNAFVQKGTHKNVGKIDTK